MFGYTVTALRVVREDADDAPLQIDNIDGQGLDIAKAWRQHFRRPLADHQVRARRYWQSARASGPVTRQGTPWVRFEVEYGSNGVPGRVVDTASRAETAQLRPQDATLSTYRHVLSRPRGGSAALLAGEQIGLHFGHVNGDNGSTFRHGWLRYMWSRREALASQACV